MNAGINSDFQLCSDAIRGGNQDGIGETGGFRIKQTAETAQPANYSRPIRGTRKRLDPFYKLRTGIDIDAGIFVTGSVNDCDAPNEFDNIDG